MAECSSSSVYLSENAREQYYSTAKGGGRRTREGWEGEKKKEENVKNKDAVQLYLPEGKRTKSSVKAVLENLGEFLTENNLEHQIQEERKDISGKFELKNEEISQERETHSHKLNEVHEAYMDLKVPEKDIFYLRNQLEELEHLNIAVSSKSVFSEREQRREFANCLSVHKR